MKDRLRLIPKQNVFLNVYGYGNDKRFAQLFYEGWKMLPLPARRTLLSYWRTRTFGPSIELLLEWSGRERFEYKDPSLAHISSTVAFAQCTHHGQSLYFWSEAVEKMPDDLVSLLVAHELSHVYTWARGGVAQEQRDRAQSKAWGIEETPCWRWMKACSLANLEEDARLRREARMAGFE